MNADRRASLSIGLILVALGGWFLAIQLVPGLSEWFSKNLSWPLIIIGAGALLLILGLLLRAPGMAVPACIIAGIGGILFWQNQNSDFGSWSYVWTLIPGFVGVGIVLSALLGGRARSDYLEGGRLILISLVLFVIFGAIFGAFGQAREWWPVLIIAAGVWMLLRPLFRKRS